MGIAPNAVELQAVVIDEGPKILMRGDPNAMPILLQALAQGNVGLYIT